MPLWSPHPFDKKRLRFNLRTLLGIVFVAALATWWIVMPSQKVNWFASEVNNGDSALAMAMVKPFEKGDSWQRWLVLHLANGKQIRSVESDTNVSVAPMSISDIIYGQRRFSVMQGHTVETTDGGTHFGYSTAHGFMSRRGIRRK